MSRISIHQELISSSQKPEIHLTLSTKLKAKVVVTLSNMVILMEMLLKLRGLLTHVDMQMKFLIFKGQNLETEGRFQKL